MTNIQAITKSINTSSTLIQYETASEEPNYDFLLCQADSLAKKVALLQKVKANEELTIIEESLYGAILAVAKEAEA